MQLRRLRLYDGIHQGFRNEPFDVQFRDWNPPEPAHASLRDRTLTPCDHFAPRAFVPARGQRSRAALPLGG